MTALTMIATLSTIIVVTMFCFNRMEFSLLSSLIASNVIGMFVGSVLELGAFATPAGMNILVLGVLLAPVFALLFNTETPAESNPSLLAANSIRSTHSIAVGVAVTVPAETLAPVRAA